MIPRSGYGLPSLRLSLPPFLRGTMAGLLRTTKTRRPQLAAMNRGQLCANTFSPDTSLCKAYSACSTEHPKWRCAPLVFWKLQHLSIGQHLPRNFRCGPCQVTARSDTPIFLAALVVGMELGASQYCRAVTYS